MRTIFTSFFLVLFVNALALGGLVGWLGMTDRLSKERVHEAAELFSLTLAEQDKKEQEEEASEKAEREMFEKQLRLQQVAGGPVTPEQRLSSLTRVDDAHRDLIKRQEVEAKALYDQIDMQRAELEKLRIELEQNQKAFDRAVDKRTQQMEDEDFRQAVAMFEGIPAKQTKAMFQELLRNGEQEQVVEYLAAMDERKANSVLREFKLPNEVTQATELVEKVRMRSDQIKQEAGL